MRSPSTGHLRLVRAGLLTAAAMGLSTTAHHAAGGSLPGLLIIALLGEAVWAVAYVCARWRLSLPVLTLLMGTGQVLLHQAFMAFSMPASMSAPSLAAPSTHAYAHGTFPGSDIAAGGAGRSPSVTMTLAHIAVTLVLVVVLAAGERAIWRLWCWLTPRVLRLPVLAPRLIFRAAPVRAVASTRVLVLRLLAADPRRGPPLLPTG